VLEQQDRVGAQDQLEQQGDKVSMDEMGAQETLVPLAHKVAQDPQVLLVWQVHKVLLEPQAALVWMVELEALVLLVYKDLLVVRVHKAGLEALVLLV